MPILSLDKPKWDTVGFEFWVANESLPPVQFGVERAVKGIKRKSQASALPLLLLLLLLFLAQLPLICESQTEAPCTVLTQNRNRVHIMNYPKLGLPPFSSRGDPG